MDDVEGEVTIGNWTVEDGTEIERENGGGRLVGV